MSVPAIIILELIRVLKLALETAHNQGQLDELEAARIQADLIEISRFGKTSRG